MFTIAYHISFCWPLSPGSPWCCSFCWPTSLGSPGAAHSADHAGTPEAGRQLDGRRIDGRVCRRLRLNEHRLDGHRLDGRVRGQNQRIHDPFIAFRARAPTCLLPLLHDPVQSWQLPRPCLVSSHPKAREVQALVFLLLCHMASRRPRSLPTAIPNCSQLLR